MLAAQAVRFIKQSAGTPFVIEVATFAPHAPYTPAPRDADAFPGLRAPRTPAFNAAPDADAPQWLRALPALSPADIAGIDRDFRKRAQSVLAIDTMIGELQAAVAAIGASEQYLFRIQLRQRLSHGRAPPDAGEDDGVRYRHPRSARSSPDRALPAGRTVDEIVENIDLCPTFTELGGAATAANVDGRSLVPLLHGQQVDDWRNGGAGRAPRPAPATGRSGLARARAAAIRRPMKRSACRHALYVEYATGEKEYHDLAADPDELRNTFSSLSAEEKASLHATLEAVQTCRDAVNCWAAERSVRSAMRN